MTARLLLLGAVLLPIPAWAEICAPAEEVLPADRYLRALSLDLRGRLPEPEELAEVEVEGEVPEALLDRWLATEDFAQQVVRRHRALLWNNISGTRLISNNAFLGRVGLLHWRRNLATLYRGDLVPCLDEPAQFDADGRVVPTVVADGVRLEGYVEVSPYWAPEQVIRLCGFDAQVDRMSPDGTDCSTLDAYRDAGCGCGPDLRWCALGANHRQVNDSMAEALDRLVFEVVHADAPYVDLFRSRTAYVNGTLAFFWRHHTGLPRMIFEPVPLEVESLPDLEFTERDTWVKVELPPEHAGILTRPGYLLRFQTNRARANRFYDAFLCQPFQPPAGGLPTSESEGARDPDLQQRAGCKYCHALLEPSAAHWGRWTESGVGFLDPADFPQTREDCELCARRGLQCSRECRNFYVTRAFSEEEERFLGSLQAYSFRREDHLRNIEVGPRLLAMTGVADGRVPRCVARRALEWLVDGAVEDAWVGSLARDFVANDYSYRGLVRSIVTDPRYRRVR